MNKTELVAAIAEKTGLTKKDAEGAVKAFTDTVAEQLKAGDKIQLVGFGTTPGGSYVRETALESLVVLAHTGVVGKYVD